MRRLIVKEQEGLKNTGLLELPDKAKYLGVVLWEESTNGPITQFMIDNSRWLKLEGGTLIIDEALKTSVEAADATKTAGKNAKATLKANVKAYDGMSNPNQVLKDLIALLVN